MSMARGKLRVPSLGATAIPRHARRTVVLLLSALAASALVACAHSAMPQAGVAAEPAAPEVLLLGEVHDSAAGHAARVERLRARLAAGWRPAIAMEQFDSDRQAALDAAMRECTDADCVVARAAPAKAGWTWRYYAPVIALALEYRLPLLAANLSRADASKVVGGGFAAALPPALIADYRLDALSPALLSAQRTEVRDSHCGLLPESMVEPMARAQVARDVTMAETLRAHRAQGVVLLAGNGHVRRDIGVPYWLRQAGLAPHAVGFLEPDGDASAFDEVERIPAVERPDPCAALKEKTDAGNQTRP
jgi:uncharacterized iron-regulated protein